jgi:sarcosine oxidase, subunit gamma
VTAEDPARTGAVDRFADDLAGLPRTVRVVPEPFVAMVDVRVDAAAAADLGLPTTPCTWVETDGGRAIWLGPDEWLVTSPARAPHDLESSLRAAVAGRGAVVDVSAQRTTLRLYGEHARDVLAGGCSVDLHPRVFRRGSAVQTLLGHAGVLLVALDDTATAYDVLVRASFAGYLVSWLVDAAVEHRGG